MTTQQHPAIPVHPAGGESRKIGVRAMFSSSRVGRRRMGAAIVGLSAVVAVTLSGCASDQQSGASAQNSGSVPPRLDPALYQKAVDGAKQLAGGQKLDKSIEMVGVNGGAEGD